MTFFPLPTSPPICLLLLPSGTRVRRSDLPQMVSSAPTSCSALATLETHPLSFYPLAWFTFFSPVSSPRYSSFSFFPPRDLSLPSLLVSLHSLLLYLWHVAQWLYHVLTSLTSPVTMCLYVGLSVLFLYVHFPLDAFGYVFNVFLEKFVTTRTQKLCGLRTLVQICPLVMCPLFLACVALISRPSHVTATLNDGLMLLAWNTAREDENALSKSSMVVRFSTNTDFNRIKISIWICTAKQILALLGVDGWSQNWWIIIFKWCFFKNILVLFIRKKWSNINILMIFIF